jgi:hypothetical protein
MAETELRNTVAWIKHHPYLASGAVFVGGAVLIYLYYSSGKSAPAATQSSGGTDTSYLQAQLQAEAASQQAGIASTEQQNQLTAATTQLNDQLSLGTNTNATNLSIAQLQAQTDQLSISTLGSVSLAGILAQTQQDSINVAGQVSLAGITTAATTAQDSLNVAGQVSLANITANENDTVAQLNAQTAQLYSTNNTRVQLNQENQMTVQQKQSLDAQTYQQWQNSAFIQADNSLRYGYEYALGKPPT